MENAPAVKANEANLEELNKNIVEIKRKIVLKGESLIISTSVLYLSAGKKTFKVQNLMTRLSFSAVPFISSLNFRLLISSRGTEEGQYWGMGELLSLQTFAFETHSEFCFQRTPRRSNSPRKSMIWKRKSKPSPGSWNFSIIRQRRTRSKCNRTQFSRKRSECRFRKERRAPKKESTWSTCKSSTWRSRVIYVTRKLLKSNSTLTNWLKSIRSWWRTRMRRLRQQWWSDRQKLWRKIRTGK